MVWTIIEGVFLVVALLIGTIGAGVGCRLFSRVVEEFHKYWYLLDLFTGLGMILGAASGIVQMVCYYSGSPLLGGLPIVVSVLLFSLAGAPLLVALWVVLEVSRICLYIADTFIGWVWKHCENIAVKA